MLNTQRYDINLTFVQSFYTIFFQLHAYSLLTILNWRNFFLHNANCSCSLFSLSNTIKNLDCRGYRIQQAITFFLFFYKIIFNFKEMNSTNQWHTKSGLTSYVKLWANTWTLSSLYAFKKYFFTARYRHAMIILRKLEFHSVSMCGTQLSVFLVFLIFLYLITSPLKHTTVGRLFNLLKPLKIKQCEVQRVTKYGV